MGSYIADLRHTCLKVCTMYSVAFLILEVGGGIIKLFSKYPNVF